MKKMGFLLSLWVISGAVAQEPQTTPLFDGKTLSGWTTLSGEPVTTGWEVVDGTIHRSAKGGDIVTERVFSSFDLRFEWKVAPGTNSGVKYHFGSYGNQTLGIEYQIVDSAPSTAERPIDNKAKHAAGAIYDLFVPDAAASSKPAGAWNTARIVVDGATITHYLNGKKTASVTMGSPLWRDALAQSKFKKIADFGQKPGKILLQDHGGEVWYRNIEVSDRSAYNRGDGASF